MRRSDQRRIQRSGRRGVVEGRAAHQRRTRRKLAQADKRDSSLTSSTTKISAALAPPLTSFHPASVIAFEFPENRRAAVGAKLPRVNPPVPHDVLPTGKTG